MAPPHHARAGPVRDGARREALRLTLGAVALVALIALAFTRGLPTRALAEGETGAPEHTAVASQPRVVPSHASEALIGRSQTAAA